MNKMIVKQILKYRETKNYALYVISSYGEQTEA